MGSVLTDLQYKQLDAIAQMAKGSWFSERKSGGSGFMGSFVDGDTGQTRYIKFAIHRGERKSLKGMEEGDRQFFAKMSAGLEDDLRRLAKAVGLENDFNTLLGGNRDKTTPDFLTRKFVAKAVNLIADKNTELQKRAGEVNQVFSWKGVTRLKAEDDTSMRSVRSDVEVFTKRGNAGSREVAAAKRDFSIAGKNVDAALRDWEANDGYSVNSSNFEALKMGLEKGFCPSEWKSHDWVPAQLPKNKEYPKGLSYNDYLKKIFQAFLTNEEIKNLGSGESWKVRVMLENATKAVDEALRKEYEKGLDIPKPMVPKKEVEVANNNQEIKGNKAGDNKEINLQGNAQNNNIPKKKEQPLVKTLDDAEIFEFSKTIDEKLKYVMNGGKNTVEVEELKKQLAKYETLNETLSDVIRYVSKLKKFNRPDLDEYQDRDYSRNKDYYTNLKKIDETEKKLQKAQIRAESDSDTGNEFFEKSIKLKVKLNELKNANKQIIADCKRDGIIIKHQNGRDKNIDEFDQIEEKIAETQKCIDSLTNEGKNTDEQEKALKDLKVKRQAAIEKCEEQGDLVKKPSEYRKDFKDIETKIAEVKDEIVKLKTDPGSGKAKEEIDKDINTKETELQGLTGKRQATIEKCEKLGITLKTRNECKKDIANIDTRIKSVQKDIEKCQFVSDETTKRTPEEKDRAKNNLPVLKTYLEELEKDKQALKDELTGITRTKKVGDKNVTVAISSSKIKENVENLKLVKGPVDKLDKNIVEQLEREKATQKTVVLGMIQKLQNMEEDLLNSHPSAKINQIKTRLGENFDVEQQNARVDFLVFLKERLAEGDQLDSAIKNASTKVKGYDKIKVFVMNKMAEIFGGNLEEILKTEKQVLEDYNEMSKLQQQLAQNEAGHVQPGE